MANKDLHNPLRRRVRRPRLPRPPVVAPVIISAALCLAVIAAFWVAIVDDPDGGRTVAAAIIEDAPAATGSLPAAEPTSGASQRLSGQLPAAAGSEPALARLPVGPAEHVADPGLVEPSAFGPLPRVSPDGRRPRDAYARPSPPAPPEAPRVVLVVGGLGLSQTGTQAAIAALPEDVTLAFAPYGSSLERWAGKARTEGHEVLLQVPLEPIGYPQANPGERTLLVSADRHTNQRNLAWLLGRATGYAGVMNYMGARFTSDDKALLPFLGEIGRRGLFYLDDGSSPQSVADRVGEALAVPVVTADVILDRDRSPQAIERELAALESQARERGLAVGVASAFPASVEAVAGWAREAAGRGIVIIPASAAIQP
jgi:polysaccharide deacetylase 2 family uncharacterized protein YibQ